MRAPCVAALRLTPVAVVRLDTGSFTLAGVLSIGQNNNIPVMGGRAAAPKLVRQVKRGLGLGTKIKIK